VLISAKIKQMEIMENVVDQNFAIVIVTMDLIYPAKMVKVLALLRKNAWLIVMKILAANKIVCI